MSTEGDFRALMAGDAMIAGLVSTRIYPSTYAQATTAPAMRYMRVAGGAGLHMQGSDGLDGALMQVDARGLTASSTLAVRDAIVAKLHGFSGTQGATSFQLIELQADRGIQFDDTGPTAYYTASLEFAVWAAAA